MKKKVLVIENEKMLRENIVELLEIAGYAVKSAPDGKVGLQHAHSFNPDIIICDIAMPVMDGYTLLEKLSKNRDTDYIPFIFLSAKAEKEDMRKGMDMGADDYLAKPFDEKELLAAVASRLAKSHLLKERREQIGKVTGFEVHDLEALKKYIQDNGTYFSFSKNEKIYYEGDRGSYVYLIERGAVKSYRINEEGKEISTGLSSDNELFGLGCIGHDGDYNESAIALKDTTAYGISKEKFTGLMEKNTKMALAMIDLLTDTILHRNSYVLKIAYESVRRKTAETILCFAKVLHTGPGGVIKIARGDLASVAGVATETIIRTLNDFKKEGLIDIEHHNIKLLRIEELQNMV